MHVQLRRLSLPGTRGRHSAPARSRVAEEPKCERELVTLPTNVPEKRPISNCAELALVPRGVFGRVRNAQPNAVLAPWNKAELAPTGMLATLDAWAKRAASSTATFKTAML